MLRVVLISLMIILNSAFVLQQSAEFNFLKNTLKFPKTKEGEVLRFQFEFTNSGNAPLVISDIKPTMVCPCTQVEYPQEPVMPGKSAMIKVSFDTKGKIGYQDRILEVYSNATKSPYKLRFKVNVDNK